MRKSTSKPSAVLDKSEVQRTLGEHLRLLRKRSDLTQEELAHRLSVSKNAVSELERGVTFPTLETLLKLAAVLELRLVDLFDFEGCIPRAPELQRLVAAVADQPAWVRSVVADQAQVLVKALGTNQMHD